MQKYRCKTITRKEDWFETVFERPNTSLFKLAIMWFSPTLINVKFTPVVGFGMKFVKSEFLVKSTLP